APNLEDVLRLAEPVRDKVSTVALAAPADEASGLAQRIARWGATRICAVGRMQSPPLGWRHDGRPALGDLVTWTDWEQ
ncbi:MAG: acyl-CoA reductase, partial [Verrucomicrobia bacterium]|nr:acyl-CoA reductase [Verrucomicrobiota bacterium]